MREFSKLAPVSASRKSVSVFGGYNHTEQCADGEWYEEKNLRTDAYPAMAVEKKRGIMAGSPTFLRGAVAAVGKDYPVAICESTTQGKGHLVCGSHRLENVIDLSEAMRPKQMVSTGAFCVIWPDKYFVNARKLYDGESMVAGQDYGSLGYSFQVTSAQMGENVLKANQCLTDGTVISPARSSTAPSDAQDGDYWMDTGAETRTLYRYSANSASWAAVSSPYVRISYPHIVKDADGTVNLCAGDAIRVLLANFDTLYLDGVYYIEKACSSTDADAMGEQTDYIVLRGAMIGDDIDSGQAESGSAAYTLKLARERPDLDYVVECENRIRRAVRCRSSRQRDLRQRPGRFQKLEQIPWHQHGQLYGLTRCGREVHRRGGAGQPPSVFPGKRCREGLPFLVRRTPDHMAEPGRNTGRKLGKRKGH